MDLTCLLHADENFIELGVVEFVRFDGIISLRPDPEGNDWEAEIVAEDFDRYGFALGHYLYFAGTEWGGRLEKIIHVSKTHTVKLGGVTWRGMLARRAILPPAGQSHLDLRSSDVNAVMRLLIQPFGGLFAAPASDFGELCTRRFRYQNVLEGICDMLDAYRMRLVLTLDPDSRQVLLSSAAVTDRSDEIEFSGDYDYSYTSTLGEAMYNHVVALGRGEQENRTVRHVWLLPDGTATTDPNAQGIATGADERMMVYDYSSCEDEDELVRNAKKQLKEHCPQNRIEISMDSEDIDIPLGDRVGLRDRITGMSDIRTVTSKLLGIASGSMTLRYTAE